MSNPYYNPKFDAPKQRPPVSAPPPSTGSAVTTQPVYIVTTSEERTLAAIAHGSALLTLFTGFAGIIVAFFIWLSQRDRSTYVAYQALQATVFQLACLAGVALSGLVLALLWVVTGILSLCLVGVLLVPVAFVATIVLVILPILAAGYAIYAAYQTSQGRDYRYPYVGAWLARRMASHP